MLLYMIRHGETENNLAKRHSGHSLTSATFEEVVWVLLDESELCGFGKECTHTAMIGFHGIVGKWSACNFADIGF